MNEPISFLFLDPNNNVIFLIFTNFKFQNKPLNNCLFLINCILVSQFSSNLRITNKLLHLFNYPLISTNATVPTCFEPQSTSLILSQRIHSFAIFVGNSLSPPLYKPNLPSKPNHYF